VNGQLPSAARIEIFESLDSTSREARRRADAGERGPVWFVAIEQTAGYGRRGSAWQQTPGDFAGTLLFEEAALAETIGELSFVAGLAVAEALERLAPGGPLQLKWPNDVLADGAKISGVLLELVESGAASLIALGIGVNIVSKPEGVDYPTARLLDRLGAAPAPAPAEVAAALDTAFAAWRATWRRSGFAPVRAAWLARAAGLGAQIRVRLENATVTGVFQDLDPSGALVLDCDDGPRTVRAGAVLPGRGG
jgi:BirA family biotin operon repressor/biotin-[acetyl-CoA-carboxylase] ligase